MYLIFDTETTGLPGNYKSPVSDSENWPRCVQIAWQLHDGRGKLMDAQNLIIKPEDYTIPYNAEKVHGISTERALKEGHDLREVLNLFLEALAQAEFLVGHNIEFDVSIMGAELYRKEKDWKKVTKMPLIDTKEEGTDFCKIPGGKGGKFKWPTLTELHQKLFGEAFDDAHDAAYDVDATARCFFGLIENSVIKPKDGSPIESIRYEAPSLAAANFSSSSDSEEDAAREVILQAKQADIEDLKDISFSHLHCHSQFSLLQSTSSLEAMAVACKEMGMSALALTDHGNMMGAFSFVKECKKYDVKPILGCEFYLCKNRLDKSQKDDGFQSVLLAKNKEGYQNLIKLASAAYVEGFYYVPRIDKELLAQYKEHLIATTGGLWGEIPYLILNVGENQAEEAFLWWKEQFGDDFYIEINRHGIPEEEKVNEVLLAWAKKHQVKYFASNNTYYTEKEEAKAHDILLCVKDGETLQKPKKYIGRRGREYRFGFPNDEFYLKSPEEMKKLYADLPEAISCTQEIVEKISDFDLARSVLLPKFEIPDAFKDPKDLEDGGTRGENNYLKHLTYEGAKKRYGEITEEIRERLDFELETIEKTGYPGYFLIVQDFTSAAREMGVSVGPGRGSAAGSAVAYCTGITNVDPIAYDLLFERFLNPDRVSLPDIDIDFDDEGRQKVIDYVINKYGANQVAQIITYGKMAAKSAIRDAARVLELPLPDADRIAKLIPDMAKLHKIFSVARDKKELSSMFKNNAEQLEKVMELIRLASENSEEGKVIQQARVLEGSVRNTGIHACGVIITPDDLTKFVPVALAKDTEMFCTQFDNAVVEDAGLLKMDFLGLKTLTLIKDAVKIIKERHGVELDTEKIPIDDTKTYELFQAGDTVGIFQYESEGMQKHMRDLKPTEFSDLIAMNALYRPGPIEYIPSFIARKQGREEIRYDLPEMEEYLEETYGITVYQEQVMLLSQKLAGFSKGEADVLRKAMGKKIMALLEKLKPKFLDQGMERGHPKDILEKIWKDWEAFAKYAFNKSHSTCYAWVAYQTAYLKAHYPAEYMASVLSNNMGDIKTVTFFIEECKRMKIEVLGPDVNESNFNFTVNDKGAIRFGLSAIKGAGAAAVMAIVDERKANGSYKDIFDFSERLGRKSINKKTLESLALAGGFDCFEEFHRRQYIEAAEGDIPLIEKVVKYAQRLQQEKESSQTSLFGGEGMMDIPRPKVLPIEAYGDIQKLNIEKEHIGLYISGHPLDQYALELKTFCNLSLAELQDLEVLEKRRPANHMIGGIVGKVAHRMSKNGKPFGTLEIQDYSGSHEFFLFSEDYLKFKEFFETGYFLHLTGDIIRQKWRNNEPEFKIRNIQLLDGLLEKNTKGVRVLIQARDISQNMIDSLVKLTENHPGPNQLEVKCKDEEEKIDINLFSRTTMVDASNGFLDELKAFPGLGFELIKR